MSWIENEMCAVVVESNKKTYLNWIENSESNLTVGFESNCKRLAKWVQWEAKKIGKMSKIE